MVLNLLVLFQMLIVMRFLQASKVNKFFDRTAGVVALLGLVE